MRPGVRLGGVAVAAMLAVLGTGGVTPAPAAAATAPSYVVMYSDGDYIGGGTQRVFDSLTGTVGVQGSAADLTVNVSGGAAGDAFALEFAAAPGDVLASGGIYTDAQRAPFRSDGHPGIDISGDGRGCNTDTGLFEVKDIATDASGAVTRLWIVYEEHCEGGRAAVWGEVSIGESPSTTPLLEPSIVRWPATDVGAPNTVVPVTVEAVGGPITINSTSIAGTNAGDFAVRADECSGKPLVAGATCQVWLRFVAAAAGTRTATLSLVDASGASHTVALQGFAYGGTTSVTMTSDAGDYIGQGQTYSYSLANGDDIGLSGGRAYAGFGVNGANGDWWSADFVPAQGDILVAGSTYANATRYPFNGSGPGLDVSGNGRGCNTLTGSFTVNAASFAADGTLESASISFVQHCEGATPAFHGTWAFRAGDTTSPAPWMIPTAPVPAPPPPSSSVPTISSFAPSSGAPGASVTITGTNFDGTTGVAFDGTTASFAVSSSTQITATVPQNATTGAISVTTAAGTAASSSSFTVTAPPPPPGPTISSFAPASGTPGTTVTITGTNLTGAMAVAFNGTDAVFNVVSATQIQTSVPSGATSGPLSVRTPSGTATSTTSFAVTGATPTISSFAPASGPPGTTVTLTGTNFSAVSAVAFNGTSAVFSVVSTTQIRASVPSAATSGKLTVTTSSGSAQSAGVFTVTGGPPAIASFSPTSGAPGTTVTIEGSNLTGATAVTFNGAGAVFNAVSSSQIQTVVPSGASSGKIAVQTPSGTAQSTADFTVGSSGSSAPTISSFSPASGPPGTKVTIAGSNLGNASAVVFDGSTAAFTIVSATQIQATVPASAATGTIAVTTPGGTARSASAFTVTAPPPPAPTISSFSPAAGMPGTTVTVDGTNLAGATAVAFAGTAASFTLVSATELRAVVPAAATTGALTVTTPGGTAQGATDFSVTPPPPSSPTITSFSPAQGAAGTAVTLVGTNLTGATAVAFAGTPATFTVVSSTQIQTAVPAGAASGTITVTTPGGTAASATGFSVPAPAPAPSPPSSGGSGGGSSGVPPDLHVAVRASATVAPPAAGELDYVITTTSVSAGGSSDVRLTVTLPNGYVVTRVDRDRGPGCTGTATLTCDLAWINPSTSTTVWIFGTVGSAGAQSLTATATSLLEPELNPADNTVTLGVPAAAPTTPVVPPTPPPAHVQQAVPRVLTVPSITGRRRVGSTLRAIPPTFSAAAASLRYRWQSCRRGTCVAIPHATRPSLRVPAALAGRDVRVSVSARVGGRTITTRSRTIRIAARRP